jgi:hypothetical protein
MTGMVDDFEAFDKDGRSRTASTKPQGGIR